MEFGKWITIRFCFFLFSVYGIETDNLCLSGKIYEIKMAALENVVHKDFACRFLIEKKHTYEELVTEIRA